MKISDSLRLTQKRDLMVYLFKHSLKIDELFFVKEIIYNEPSYSLATKIARAIPATPTVTLNNEKSCQQYCEDFIKELKDDVIDYYIILPSLGLCEEVYGLVARPTKPILKVSSSHVTTAYEVFFSKKRNPNNLLICSEDFKKGIHVSAHADTPTEENGYFDDDLFECFTWNND